MSVSEMTIDYILRNFHFVFGGMSFRKDFTTEITESTGKVLVEKPLWTSCPLW